MQLGAREHYAIPRALHAKGVLTGLFTDVWVPPANPLGLLKRALQQRFHPELANARVTAANFPMMRFEVQTWIRGMRDWNQIMARNDWFQQLSLRVLEREKGAFTKPTTIFAYSYAALAAFRFAKASGLRTVLGQIDAGPEMSRIVSELRGRHPDFSGRGSTPPPAYWNHWREECALADAIVVNSEWSRNALAVAGIDSAKVQIIPLAYQPPGAAVAFQRGYPSGFTRERPLRVLFLGQVNLAKGIVPVLEAADRLRNEPVEFYIVGPMLVRVPEGWLRQPQIRWCGPVSRAEVAAQYQSADVFLFPTFSDGFGLTQLEAQAWKLPIIASKFCGNVVKDGVNGFLLPELTVEAIVNSLRRCLEQPALLSKLSNASFVAPEFQMDNVISKLQKTV